MSADHPASVHDRDASPLEAACIKRDRAESGEATVSLELPASSANRAAGSPTGAMMQLLESAMVHAALSKVDYTMAVITLDISLTFLKPASGRLVAVGRVIGGGRSVCFCEARLTDAAGDLAAQAMGTLKYRPNEAPPEARAAG